MAHKNEKEIRTGTKNILICKCREENGIPTLEFIHQKKKDKITVDELLKKIYGK